MAAYRKQRAFSPQGFFECEGKGLLWLGKAQAQGGVRVVDVYGWSDSSLEIERVSPAYPTAQAAYAFGASLARTHDAGARSFGCAPDDYDGVCYFGPLQDPVPMDTGDWDNVADYWSEGRLRPMVKLGIARGELTNDDLELTERVIDVLPRLLGKAIDEKPARVHGDLWSGNVMWSADRGDVEAVLIDPAAHGGCREEDLAMLDLFGMSYLDAILDGYQSVHPLKQGWRERMTLWQLYPIAGHCVFFGGGYVSQYRAMCRSLLR